jgi:very-short-patch-repair endonuclease
MRKTLSVRPAEHRTDASRLQKRGRGWNIAESRLDTLHETAREMRRAPTEAHARLHEALTKAELGKYRFKRQTVIGSAIVDFACQPLKVVVQIDEPEANAELDRRRDASLAEVGMKVLRYSAAEVLADANAVAAAIFAEMKMSYDERRARKPQPARRTYQR